ncbi:MAG: glycosyltransferase family 2 protein [Terriglobales bacterium]|jgi:glycosyltransferase involved in cell wall biosynthesis
MISNTIDSLLTTQPIMDRQSPCVSVVIPTRNRRQLVLRAIHSALRQTFTDIEVIAVIDGPDPDTVAALGSITDSRLRVLTVEHSVGGAEARNLGISAARGNWIALLDDDDEWLPEKTEKQLSIAEAAGSPYILVFSRMIARLPNIEFLWPRRLPKVGEDMSEYLFCRNGLTFGEGFLQTSSFFASRQMFLEVPFRRDQKRFQDTDWILRACAHPKSTVAVAPEALVVYYMDDQRESVSRKPDWAYLHNWAVENRALFTPRAFSFFLATQCVPRAAKQRQPMTVFFRLLRECMFDGEANATCLFLCGLFWFVPEDARHRLRDALSGERKQERALTKFGGTKPSSTRAFGCGYRENL